MSSTDQAQIHSSVQDYYGKKLTGSKDLKTSACTSCEAPSPTIRAALSNIHEEVASKFYGCGLVVPENVKGATILDLGCGTGRDCYMLSQLVGPDGRVIGVDMTAEQLEVANKHKQWHADKFGYPKSNVDFKQGQIEDLTGCGIKEGEVDIVVSNCVVNLCPDKGRVLREIFRVLKEGGELYFSDVYSNRRFPNELKKDELLWGECISGALYWNDFYSIAKAAGFKDPRLVSKRTLGIHNKEIEGRMAEFGLEIYSATFRLFKINSLDDQCEDYGQAVQYKGTDGFGTLFKLDQGHVFEKGKIIPVCRNTFLMLHCSRLATDFEFLGASNSVHYGPFACETSTSGGTSGSTKSIGLSKCCS